ncbi:MAG: heme lyase CcmF/NrfE family subunit [Acidiferrobacterales bacterium]|nr:heme lyase CcmF/NrfE family subunit [Acidiferrobacterales bacterium]
MIPELGHYALILALVLSILLSVLPLYGTLKGVTTWVALAKPLALNLLLMVAVSYICLTWAFLQNDFSVSYVAGHSNTRLPLIYKISGVWGGHEGSLLLWMLILAVWTGAVALFTRQLPEIMSARVLSVLGMISVGIILFMLLTSNPFARLFPAPLEGRDLNPLLQDIGLAIHPPMLYIGYFGFSVAFAFAIAAMIGGRLDAAWARWSRPWTNIAWMFLTIGIALGSWWAYYELGWGGWWFWDPVENASFMPWLVGTALIHSLAATEKRGVFKAWSILLAVLAFSLSLLGTFLVRSGVLTSVHAFATDPARGLFILIFLCVVVGASLILYAWRAPTIRSFVRFELISRETAILINNVFMGVLCFVVLVGTLYPLVLDAIAGKKISVGPPYFDTVFTLIGIPLLILMAIATAFRWKKDTLSRTIKPHLILFVLSVCLALAIQFPLSDLGLMATVGITLGVWVVLSTLVGLWGRTRPGQRMKGLTSTPRSIYGMSLAHVGIGVFIIGVSMVNTFSIEKDLRMAPGERFDLGRYSFVFNGVNDHEGPNYLSRLGEFEVWVDDAKIAILRPEKRTYLVQQNPMTEAAIDPSLSRDLYVALGEPLDAQGAWAVRIYLKPYIRWIWLGCLLMGLGGGLAAMDKRYRRRKRVAVEELPVGATT